MFALYNYVPMTFVKYQSNYYKADKHPHYNTVLSLNREYKSRI